MKNERAIFPGSFDPFTRGHKEIVDRGLEMFGHITIAVGFNIGKGGLLPVVKRVELIRDIYAAESRVSVEVYEGLTTEFCKKNGVGFILRGVRNASDFEFEYNMDQVNRLLYPDIETVLLISRPGCAAISSSAIREIHAFGGDTTIFMPEGVELKKYL